MKETQLYYYIWRITYKYKQGLSGLLIGLYQTYLRTCPFGPFHIISQNDVECEAERCCSTRCTVQLACIFFHACVAALARINYFLASVHVWIAMRDILFSPADKRSVYAEKLTISVRFYYLAFHS
jgi:hypothetical protein